MEREQALEELKSRIIDENIIKHSLSVEAIMRSFGRYYKDDEEKWAITGLLHDIDYEKTKDDPTAHGLVAGEILEDLGADESIVYAIKAHNDANGLERKRRLDKVLFCANPFAKLVIDFALAQSSQKLEDVTEELILKKIEEAESAKDANIEKIRACTEVGIELEEFIKLSLTALKSVASDIGL